LSFFQKAREWDLFFRMVGHRLSHSSCLSELVYNFRIPFVH
jgi:hypothetical protein